MIFHFAVPAQERDVVLWAKNTLNETSNGCSCLNTFVPGVASCLQEFQYLCVKPTQYQGILYVKC